MSRLQDNGTQIEIYCTYGKKSDHDIFYISSLFLNRKEFAITNTSEKAIDAAAIIGFRNPAAAIGMAIML